MWKEVFVLCYLFIGSYALIYPDDGGPPYPTGTCNSKRASQLALLKGKKNDPTFWVPECDKDNNYLMVQKRQNKQQFCVEPATGVLINWKNPQPKNPNDSINCKCPVQSFASKHSHVRGWDPYCDEKTGLFLPYQDGTPTGVPFCVDSSGNNIQRDPPPKTKADCNAPPKKG